MIDKTKPKITMGTIALLAGMVIFALFVAFVVGPMISESSGIADVNVSFILGGIFFVIAAGCYTALKFMAPKKNPEDPK